jgi:hypothetical protein
MSFFDYSVIVLLKIELVCKKINIKKYEKAKINDHGNLHILL